METSRKGVVFVHGINNSREERKKLPKYLNSVLKKYNCYDLFKNPTSSMAYTFIGEWRSLGNFTNDLEDLFRHEVRREDALEDIKTVIKASYEKLIVDADKENDTKSPVLLVVGHSMGQVLSRLAMKELEDENLIPLPTSLLTLGGPLGNMNPVVDKYLQWAKSKLAPSSKLTEWVDVFNKDDPVCYDLLFGHKAFSDSKATVFDFPGKPALQSPLEEHSSYFKDVFCFDLLKRMISILESSI